VWTRLTSKSVSHVSITIRAIDKEGQTIEFLLSAKRDVSAAKRFFKKMMRADHRRLPFSISVDKNAAYSEAFTSSQDEKILPKDCKLRRVKYLNNIIEQDHRFIKKKVRASQCFKKFHTAERTIEGIESINMMRKGQVSFAVPRRVSLENRQSVLFSRRSLLQTEIPPSKISEQLRWLERKPRHGIASGDIIRYSANLILAATT
jgi:transposase-like protein